MALAYPRAYPPGVLGVLDGVEPTEFDVDRGVARLRVPDHDLLVFHQRPPEIEQVLDEADRLLWMDGRAGAPRLVATGRAVEGDETIVAELSRLAVPLAGGLARVNPEALAAELGRALRRLHEVGIDDCPFESASESHLRSAETAIATGKVEPAMDGPYVGRSPAELLEILAGLFAELPTPHPVLVHGGLDVDRIWLAPDGRITFTGWQEAGAGDRHLDLAAVAVSVGAEFGLAVVAPFLDAYGLDHINLVSLDAHQLLVHLMP